MTLGVMFARISSLGREQAGGGADGADGADGHGADCSDNDSIGCSGMEQQREGGCSGWFRKGRRRRRLLFGLCQV
jgi:hypothetical protein